MIKDRLISEACDFGVVYSLFLKRAGANGAFRRVIVKIGWDEERPPGEPETHSCVYELNVDAGTMHALGRKGNQLPAERFCAKRICAWAKRELADYGVDL